MQTSSEQVAFFLVAFHYFYVDVARKILDGFLCNAASAHDHHIPDLVVFFSCLFFHKLDVLLHGYEIHHIIGHKFITAIRDDGMSVSVDGYHTEFAMIEKTGVKFFIKNKCIFT